MKGDQAERGTLMAKFVEQRRAMPCDVAVERADRSEVELLVDMLKWPVCRRRDGVMLRIAELQRARPEEFGKFGKAGDRSSFRADLRTFIAWLKTQRNSNGKPFDVEGPPRYSPSNL